MDAVIATEIHGNISISHVRCAVRTEDEGVHRKDAKEAMYPSMHLLQPLYYFSLLTSYFITSYFSVFFSGFRGHK